MLHYLKEARIRVWWDGEDWLHRWPGGFIAFPFPTTWAPRMIGRHVPLFTADYRPQQGDVVVDLGAGIGTEVAVWSQLVGSQGRVIAVEADPASCRRLRKLVAHLGLSNVEIIEAAIGDRIGSATFSQGTEEGQENRVVESADTSTRVAPASSTIQVAMTTLDALCATLDIEQIDYMKVNIEGAEVAALQGMNSVLPKHVCISSHDFLNIPELFTRASVENRLSSKGYQQRSPQLPERRRSYSDYVFASL